MGYWGKLLGGMAGMAMGGPLGAVVGAALGHAADEGVRPHLTSLGLSPNSLLGSARVAALLGRRDQLFSIAMVVLSAKLAKCDGPVNRPEIDAFRRLFRIPPEALRDVGRLFDQARDSAEGFEGFADQMGEGFADNRGVLEDVLNALFAIARADGPINEREAAYLQRVHRGFGLDRTAWNNATGGRPRYARAIDAEDPYAVLGVPRSATAEELRAAWKKLMRENHPDSLASRGVPQEFIQRASDKVARINAAWDVIKRERGI
jgi:DnaJ like chaperone protein